MPSGKRCSPGESVENRIDRRIAQRLFYWVLSSAIGVYGFLFVFLGNAMASMGINAFRRSEREEDEQLVLTLGSEPFDEQLSCRSSLAQFAQFSYVREL